MILFGLPSLVVYLSFFVLLVEAGLLVFADGVAGVVDVDSTVFAPFLAHFEIYYKYVTRYCIIILCIMYIDDNTKLINLKRYHGSIRCNFDSVY